MPPLLVSGAAPQQRHGGGVPELRCDDSHFVYIEFPARSNLERQATISQLFLLGGNRRLAERRIRGGNTVRVHFCDGSVVRHHAVEFDLHIGRLRINRGGKTGRFDERFELFDQIQIRGGQIVAVLEFLVTPIGFGLPGVIGQR